MKNLLRLAFGLKLEDELVASKGSAGRDGSCRECEGEQSAKGPVSTSRCYLFALILPFFQFEDFIEKRDYTGALAVLEFNRLAGDGDLQKTLSWIGYCAFHLGNHEKAMKTYSELLELEDPDPLDHIYLGCCMFYLGMYAEAEAEILKGPQVPLQTRLLFHLAHKLNDEDKLMQHHGKLKTCVEDQLSLASIHYLRSHYQGLCAIAQANDF